MMWDLRYLWKYMHCIWYHTHASYLWHHSHSKYDKTPTMFVTLNSVYKTSHMMNEWQHNERIWHDTQCICVIKPKWLTSQPMYERNYTHCMYDNLGTLYDIISILFFYLWWILSYIEMKQPWFTCVPHPNPPSHLPLHPFPLGFPSAPGPRAYLMHPTWAGDLFHLR